MPISRNALLSCFLLLGSLATPYAASPGTSGKSAGNAGQISTDLDQKAIHAAYNDGDFDKVVKKLEAFTATHPTASRADSVFVAKHLAVVYSANPETREKGKYYMYRLLEMMPSAELVDMFVSDEVDRIFEKVRKEFLVRQKNFGVDSNNVALPERNGNGDAHSNMAATNANEPPKSKVQSKNGVDPVWWWVAGGVVAVGAGITAAVLMSQPKEEPGPVFVVEVP